MQTSHLFFTFCTALGLAFSGMSTAADTAKPAAAAPTPAQLESTAMSHEHSHDAPVASPAALREVPPDRVDASTVDYGVLNGKPVQGYFAKPTNTNKNAKAHLPGVILFHEWWGLNDNIRSMARQLADKGYYVLAADMYLGKSATTPQEAQGLMQTALADPALADRNIEAAYNYLKNTAKAGKIGTLGWCFGGKMSFEAGQVLSGKTDATVIYYGFVDDKAESLDKLTAPVLGIFGAKDTSIPVASAYAMQKGLEARGKRPQLRIYPDAGHAFANPSGKNYNEPDATDAWKHTLDFLAENLVD